MALEIRFLIFHFRVINLIGHFASVSLVADETFEREIGNQSAKQTNHDLIVDGKRILIRTATIHNSLDKQNKTTP
jgi:hypothetical protein